MSIRGTVGSLLESQRAKSSHPDRRNFLPQTRRLPSAAHFSDRPPQLRSIVPKASLSVPNGPPSVLIFPTALLIAKAIFPIGRMAVPIPHTIFPNFSAIFPFAPTIFPNFPATFPNFSHATRISNGLFPSHLCGFHKKMVGRVTPCAPFSRNPAPARRGLTRPTCRLSTFNHQHSTKN